MVGDVPALTGSLQQSNVLKAAIREVPLGRRSSGTDGSGELLGGLGGDLGGGAGGGLLGGVTGGLRGGSGRGLLGGLLFGGGDAGSGLLGGRGAGGTYGGEPRSPPRDWPAASGDVPRDAIPVGGAGGAMGQGRVLGDGDVLSTAGILGGPGGLLGSGGLLSILGEGGLLSTVQGLTGLRIVELTVPRVSLRLLPGIGVHLNLYTRVALNGKCLLGLLDVVVEVNITSRVRLTMDGTGYPRLVTERCDTLLGGIKVRLLRGLLPIVDNLLASLLNGVLPDLVTQQGIADSHPLPPALVPLGVLGSIQYTVSSLPLVTDQFLEVDLNTVVGLVAGGLVDHLLGKPGTVPTAPRVPMPPLPPMAATGSSQLGISVNLLSAVLCVLQKEGALDLEVSTGKFPELPPLTTWTLGALVPAVFKAYPTSCQLLLKITVPEAPVVALKENQGVIQLMATAEVMATPPGGVQEPLCLLNIVCMKEQSTQKSLLQFPSLHSGDGIWGLTLGSEPCLALSWAGLCPTEVLGVGVPLPRLLNIDFSKADMDVIEVSASDVPQCSPDGSSALRLCMGNSRGNRTPLLSQDLILLSV
uniref:BPI fold containing family B member 4 n=1 Tax=Strigops habroptila TaxID=2489341 RepID=A0A672TZT5_STRHB